MSCIVEVALPVPLRARFDYRAAIPAPQPGCRVRVPFGRRHMVAVVLAVKTRSELADEKLKTVDQVLDAKPLLDAGLLALLEWSARYYQAPIGEVVFAALPAALREGRAAARPQVHYWQLTDAGRDITADHCRRAPKQWGLLRYLHTHGMTDSATLNAAGFDQTLRRRLLEKQWICVSEQEHTPTASPVTARATPLKLTREQALAVAAINASHGQFACHLLDGVTGSGKTEVYLQTIAPVLARGEQVLVLVPEIGLTPQTLARFADRFSEPVTVLHSGLNDSERLSAWLDAHSGRARIIIGTRSAVFTPLPRLGLLIIDEEHDASFKQQEGFRYHGRDLAVLRASRQGCPVVLGSATPSLESLYHALAGKYRHLTLRQRAGQAVQTRNSLLDIKQVRLQAGLAPQLLERMEQHLLAGNQVLLFLNRRGFAPALLCHECGWLAKCDRCDAYYTWHRQEQRLCCHHCGAERPVLHQCGQCGSTQLIAAGVGTEQVEHFLAERFPDYPLVRIDRDNTRRKGQLDRYLEQIRDGHYRILLGTQMLAKGHHFPDVTLVGLLDVDGALFSADYRAPEKLAQLLIQVAGRAGRASKPGQVVVQTHHPEHPLLQELTNNGYADFARDALEERRQTQLPPYSFQALLRAEATGEHAPQQFLQPLAETLRGWPLALEVLGPMPAPMPRRAGKHRWQLLLQSQERGPLHQACAALQQCCADSPLTRQVRWSIDIDPQDFT